MARIDDAAPSPIAAAPEQLGLPFRALGRIAVHSSSIVALAIAWEAFSRSGAVTPFMLPALSAVLDRIWTDAIAGDLLLNISTTLYRAIAGFLIAAVGGITLGLVMSRNRLVHWLFDPIISVGFPMPKIAFLPIAILWLGFYDVAKISMVVFDAIFPVVTATIAGVAGVERELLWSARNMGAGKRGLLWQIVLPAASPQIMTGLQVALPIALIVTIVTEMLMGGYGIGGAMMTASRFADSRGVFAGIVETAAVGFCLVRAMALIRRRLLVWHEEVQAPTTA
jgi:ABC-type nitrate/sulfonate/bicarbonate transport system permease component